MKKWLIISFAILVTFGQNPYYAGAKNAFAIRMSGRILLQVQSQGEAWYVNPADHNRYYLGLPQDAFDIMREFGTGITNRDLNKIPVGILDYNDGDNDNDGLANRFEEALGTDTNNADTDGDGYADLLEIENNFSPNGIGSMPIDLVFACQTAGKFFLQVENQGQAWYVNPLDCRRYYLGRPMDAFTAMKSFGLGINNIDITAIPASVITPSPQSVVPVDPTLPMCQTCDQTNSAQVMLAAADAIRNGDKTAATPLFIPEIKKLIEYTLDYLDADGRLALGNILSGAALTASTDDSRTYSLEVYFSLGGYKVPVEFNLKKQPNGSWLIANL